MMAENMKDYGNIIYEDEGGGDVTDFTHIILKHIASIVKEGGKEMTGGGTRSRIINGQLIEIYVPNQREIFINAVEMLRLSLIGNIKSKKKTDAAIQELLEGLDEYKKVQKLMYTTNISNLRKYQQSNNTALDLNNETQKYLDTIETHSVNIYRKVYSLIIELLSKGDFFGEKSGGWSGTN